MKRKPAARTKTLSSVERTIHRHSPSARGFSVQNLWRMRQFYETYRAQPKLSTLSRELSWSHNMLIISRSKRPEEREFYSLTRSLSPALIAEYQTALPNKQLLQRKLHEFYQLALPAIEAPKGKPRKSRRS